MWFSQLQSLGDFKTVTEGEYFLRLAAHTETLPHGDTFDMRMAGCTHIHEDENNCTSRVFKFFFFIIGFVCFLSGPVRSVSPLASGCFSWTGNTSVHGSVHFQGHCESIIPIIACRWSTSSLSKRRFTLFRCDLIILAP